MALKEIGYVDNTLRGKLATPEDLKPAFYDPEAADSENDDGDEKCLLVKPMDMPL